MSKIFKPRRGKASTMLGTKSSTVLAAGEMFIEVPDTGVGTGVCKMKMGDGVTAYSSLPYAMGGDIASTEITGSIVEDTSTTATSALANVTTGRTLGAIIGSLRKACQLNASAIATLNDDLVGLDLQYRFQRFNISNNNGVKIFTVSDTPCVFICISSNNTTIYNYYCCSIPNGYESIVVINKIESSVVNVNLTFTYQNNNNIKITNSGNYGALLHILQF